MNESWVLSVVLHKICLTDNWEGKRKRNKFFRICNYWMVARKTSIKEGILCKKEKLKFLQVVVQFVSPLWTL